MAGIYIHVPFCASFCTYCDFYSITERSRKGAYLEALAKEAQQHTSFFNGVPLSTLYLGGGTPSLLTIDELSYLLKVIEQHLLVPTGQSVFDLEEVTIEVNPDDVTEDLARSWRNLGINRVSMGIQSFQDSVLRWMGRRHNAAQAEAAYRTLRAVGFENISLDLIFGYAIQGLSDPQAVWLQDLCRMVALAPEHISAYQLSIEPGSTLAKWVQQGKASELDAEVAAEEYALLQSQLQTAGYEQYEISNFSRPGYQARHNRSYWQRVPYLGLGPAAHSFDGHSRWWNPADLSAYVAGCGVEREVLTPKEVFNEQWLLGLRQVQGVSMNDFDPELWTQVADVVDRLFRRGDLVMTTDQRIKIPSEKLFVSDGIICELMLD